MNKQLIPMLAAVAIAATVLTSLALLSEETIADKEITDRFVWDCSGPICIRPSEVRLGESIFIMATDIPKDLTLRLAITNADGKVWDYIWADGTEKPNWNIYIKPDYSVNSGFCTWNDLVGLWTIELQGSEHLPLQFQHGPEILEGSEAHYIMGRNVCP